MPDLTGLITSVTFTGLGAVISPLIIALIQSQGKRSESRATAADLISNAAGGFVERLNKDNIDLRRTVKLQRSAILKIVDVLDDIIDNLPLDGPTEQKLKLASRLAREAAG